MGKQLTKGVYVPHRKCHINIVSNEMVCDWLTYNHFELHSESSWVRLCLYIKPEAGVTEVLHLYYRNRE